MTLVREAATIHPELVRIRRELHARPELGLRLPETQRVILRELALIRDRAQLTDADLRIHTGERLDSVTAVLTGGRPGPTVLLRGDMDALPVIENTGLEFASDNGAMHACGHDLHVTGLLGAVRLLVARRAELAGSVLFMFQPGEEGFHGARQMLEEGLLELTGERPIGAYGLHVSSGMVPHGTFTSRPGTMMAGSAELDVTVRGKGGHASAPHNAQDPIAVACELVTALQTLVTRQFSVFDPIVVTVGSFHAGTARNIIPAEASFQATIRTFGPEASEYATERIPALLNGIVQAHGLTAAVDYRPGYPVTSNAPDHVEFAAQAVSDLFGSARYRPMTDPIGGSEDFSYVLNEVPGAFLFLGACPPGQDHENTPANHSPEAFFDDAVLADAAALLAELAMRRLRTGSGSAES